MTTNMTAASEWKGRTMVGSDGEKIGKISEIYEDAQTGRPEWATVHTGLFGMKSNFVPLAGAAASGEDVRAPVTKAQVKDAPGVEADDDLSTQEERRLFEHYNVPYAQQTSTGQGQPDGDNGRTETDHEHGGRDASGATTADATTSSDSERQVGTGEREAGEPRLRRYVMIETVTETAPEGSGGVDRGPTGTERG